MYQDVLLHVLLLYNCTHWQFFYQHKYHLALQYNSFKLPSPGQNGHHFEDNIFRHISLKESVTISIQMSLKFAPEGPINSKSSLVQAMAWCQTGDKPWPEPMLTQFTNAYMWHWGRWVNLASTLSQRHHFTDDIFKLRFSWREIAVFWFKCHGNRLLSVQLTKSHHWFR